MGSAFGRIDIINKTVYAFVVRIIMLHGNFNINVIFTSFEIHNLFIERIFAFIQVRNKFLDAAFIVEYFFLFLPFSRIHKDDFKAFCQKSRFPQSRF